TIQHKRRAPRYFEYHPAPMRVLQAADPVRIGGRETAPHVDAVIFDFGAISLTYSTPLRGSLADLVDLSLALSNDEALLADSRRRIAHLLDVLGPTVSRPNIAPLTEAYAIFQLQDLRDGATPEQVMTAHAHLLAQILRAEREPLS